MHRVIRIGTRESQLAVWQAEEVKHCLSLQNQEAGLVYIKSEGDIDLKTPLYEMGVQGIFTKSLDIALLEGRIDMAVHSMKDVPTQLAEGIQQAAVLPRGPVHDLLVLRTDGEFLTKKDYVAHIATSSIRRKAQWLHRYPHHQVFSLRGNINTRLHKLASGTWDAAIFAQAGLERINLRPANSVILDWMLPAPAQGAIMVVCRNEDDFCLQACEHFNDAGTALCTRIEREFLRTLLGGCSTPVSALAEIHEGFVHFKGNLFSVDGSEKVEIEKQAAVQAAEGLGVIAARELLNNGGKEIADRIQHAAH